MDVDKFRETMARQPDTPREPQVRKPRKLKEAEFFYERLLTSQDNQTEFEYYLSAFLNSARSVLQHTHKEIEGTVNQSWYEDWMTRSPVLRFLKAQRDINVHQSPVRTLRGPISRTVHVIGEAKTLKVETADGRILFEQSKEEVLRRASEPDGETRTEARVGYHFPDWPGYMDVLALCGRCLSELRAFLRNRPKEA